MRKVAGGGAAAGGRGATIEVQARAAARLIELARAGELSGRLDVEAARAGELDPLGALRGGAGLPR